MDKILKLCFRSIIRKVNKDHDLASEYKGRALNLYENQYIHTVGHAIPTETKIKLYEMVS